MGLLLNALQCLGYFNTNTSSPLQHAIGFVASYPYYPMPSAIGNCAVEIYQQRKELWEQQGQQEEQQQKQEKKKQGGGTGKAAAQGGGGAAAAAGTAAATPLQQMIAAEVQQHLQQRSDMMLQQLHAWGLD
jgi:hypothetical protein